MALERSKQPTIHHEKTSESDTDSETPLQSHLKNALSLALATSPIPCSKQEIAMLPCYKECLKNHAASLGGLALDGCGEFMPSTTTTSHDPASLKCAACGCHRSFHRRETTQAAEVPGPQWGSSSSPSSSPVASPTPHHSIFPYAPNMLLSLSTGPSWTPLEENHHCHKTNLSMTPHSKKRARTKFTDEQKEKMHAFAERIGWRIPRGNDEKLVQEFCSEVGVNKNVFKIWMHNNKNRKDKATDPSSYDINNSNVSDSYEKYPLETKQVHIHGTANCSPPRSS